MSGAEQVAAMAEQKYPPSQEQQVDQVLDDLEYFYPDHRADKLRIVKQHIDLLRRQAWHGKNRKESLRQLNRAHRVALLELRWLKSTVAGAVGVSTWGSIIQETKFVLWRQFQKEDSVNGQLLAAARSALKSGGIKFADNALDNSIRDKLENAVAAAENKPIPHLSQADKVGICRYCRLPMQEHRCMNEKCEMYGITVSYE